jgi:hypothetical protein
MNKASKSRRLYDFSIKNWWLSALLFTLSSNWFVLVQFFGKKWGIVNAVSGELEIHGIVISSIFIVITLAFSVIRTLADRKNEDAKYRGQTILKHLLEEINASKRAKLDKYIKYASNVKTSQFMDVITPEHHVEKLFENIINTINVLFGIDKSNIGISLIYKINQNWEWLQHQNTTEDLSLEEIISNPNTTARQIIDKKKPILFFPDKRVGISNQQFVSSKLDNLYQNMGSIYCSDVGIKHNGKDIMQAVFSLTTYKQQLCGQNDSSAIDRVVADIMPTFLVRLQVELCLFYIIKENLDSNKNGA